MVAAQALTYLLGYVVRRRLPASAGWALKAIHA
jgi:hypothetical protein